MIKLIWKNRPLEIIDSSLLRPAQFLTKVLDARFIHYAGHSHSNSIRLKDGKKLNGLDIAIYFWSRVVQGVAISTLLLF